MMMMGAPLSQRGAAGWQRGAAGKWRRCWRVDRARAGEFGGGVTAATRALSMTACEKVCRHAAAPPPPAPGPPHPPSPPKPTTKYACNLEMHRCEEGDSVPWHCWQRGAAVSVALTFAAVAVLCDCGRAIRPGGRPLRFVLRAGDGGHRNLRHRSPVRPRCDGYSTPLRSTATAFFCSVQASAGCPAAFMLWAWVTSEPVIFFSLSLFLSHFPPPPNSPAPHSRSTHATHITP